MSRYTVRGEVATGGMGAILKVWDEDLRRNLAMKVILGRGDTQRQGDTPDVDESTLNRFLEEAQITGQLDHPGIVPVHELGLDAEGRVYFTMRLVKGRDFKEIIEVAHRGEGGWTITRAVGVLLKACEAMSYAHAKGVIHRDLKPANIMVGRFGEVYVMDWGLARVMGRPDKRDIRPRPAETTGVVKTDRREVADRSPDSPLRTMDGDVIGTPAYMSPEQARGAIDKIGFHSDVYNLGAILYHLLAGHMPYVTPGAAVSPYVVLRWVIEEPPTPLHELNPHAPAELVAICEKAMHRGIRRRYSNTQELGDDLRAYLENRVVKAYRSGTLVEFRKVIARNRWTATAVAAALLALLCGLAGIVHVQQRANVKLRSANALLTQSRDHDLADVYLWRAKSAQPGPMSLLSASKACELRDDAEARGLLVLAATNGAKRQRSWTLGHGVSALVMSPRGDWLAAGHRDELLVWDTATGELRLRKALSKQVVELPRFRGHLSVCGHQGLLWSCPGFVDT